MFTPSDLVRALNFSFAAKRIYHDNDNLLTTVHQRPACMYVKNQPDYINNFIFHYVTSGCLCCSHSIISGLAGSWSILIYLKMLCKMVPVGLALT